jgi:hypothetical protein
MMLSTGAGSLLVYVHYRYQCGGVGRMRLWGQSRESDVEKEGSGVGVIRRGTERKKGMGWGLANANKSSGRFPVVMMGTLTMLANAMVVVLR